MNHIRKAIRHVQQFRMLHDLEGNVDRTDGKLSSAMKKMQKFIRDTEGNSFQAQQISELIICGSFCRLQKQNLGGALGF